MSKNDILQPKIVTVQYTEFIKCNRGMHRNFEGLAINYTHRKKPCFTHFSTKIGRLVDSDLFHILTKSIEYCIFYYYILRPQMFENVIDQADVWLLLSISLTAKNNPFLRGFFWKKAEWVSVLLRNGTADFQNSFPFERQAWFYVTINGKFECCQYF